MTAASRWRARAASGQLFEDAPSRAALKMRRSRKRRKAGRLALMIEFDEVPVVMSLIDARLLDPAHEEDRDAIAEALGRYVDMSASVTGNDL